MKKICMFVSILSLLVSFSVAAEQGDLTDYQGRKLSVAFGGGQMNFDRGEGFSSITTLQLLGRISYDINEFIAFGAELGFSLIPDSENINYFGSNLKIEYSVATVMYFAKGSIPIGDHAKLYAIVGKANTELTVTASYGGVSASASTDDDDTATGFGFEKSFDNHGLAVDYITYYGKEGSEVSSLNVTYISRF